MALAAANQSAEYNLSDRDLVNFISTLNTNVVKRWSNWEKYNIAMNMSINLIIFQVLLNLFPSYILFNIDL